MLRQTWFQVAVTTVAVALLLLSSSTAQQAGIVYDEEISLKGLSAINSNINVKAWLGSPRNMTSFNNPTFTWFSVKEDSPLYVVDLLGLYEYRDTGDGVFQRSEVVRYLNFLEGASWYFGGWQTGGGGEFAALELTFAGSNAPSGQFDYLAGKLHLSLVIYNHTATRMVGNVAVASKGTEAQLLVGLDEWRWVDSGDSLALFVDLYAINGTEIQAKGLSEGDFVLGNVPWESPEALKTKMKFFAPAAFPLARLNLTEPDGEYVLLDVSRNETSSKFEQRLDFIARANQSDPFEPRNIGLADPSEAYPGYLTVSTGVFLAPTDRVERANVSYVGAGNYARLFISYPHFTGETLFYLLRMGIDEGLISGEPTPTPTAPPTSLFPSVTPPSLSGVDVLGVQAWVFVAGIAVAAFAASLLVTRKLQKGFERS